MNTDSQENHISRRSLLRLIGAGSFFLTAGIFVAGTVRFLYPRVLFEKPSTFRIGNLDSFKGELQGGIHVYETWKEEHAVWIVKEADRMYAILARCTHLGCTPRYFPDEGVFRCPCHGSQFSGNGTNIAGPAPRPLDRLHILYNSDGEIVIDRSKVYTSRDFNRKGAYIVV